MWTVKCLIEGKNETWHIHGLKDRDELDKFLAEGAPDAQNVVVQHEDPHREAEVPAGLVGLEVDDPVGWFIISKFSPDTYITSHRGGYGTDMWAAMKMIEAERQTHV